MNRLAPGTCAGIFVLSFWQKRGLPTEGLRLRQRTQQDPESGAPRGVEHAIEAPPSIAVRRHISPT